MVHFYLLCNYFLKIQSFILYFGFLTKWLHNVVVKISLNDYKSVCHKMQFWSKKNDLVLTISARSIRTRGTSRWIGACSTRTRARTNSSGKKSSTHLKDITTLQSSRILLSGTTTHCNYALKALRSSANGLLGTSNDFILNALYRKMSALKQ